MSHVVTLIPARAGSKRIPEKNIRLLDELPLVAWSIATSRAMDLETYVSSENQHILELAERFGAQPWDRPADLAGDEVKDGPVIEDFLNRVEPKVDLLVYLRPTTPTRATSVVQKAIDLMLASGNQATSLRSVHRMTESCFKRFTLIGGILEPIWWGTGQNMTDFPDHQVPPTYKPNGYVDILLPSQVSTRDLWGPRCVGYVTRPVTELDTLDDWLYLEYQLKVKGVDEVHEFYLPGGVKAAPFGL